MTLYMYQASYTAKSMASQLTDPHDPLEAIRPSLQELGAADNDDAVWATASANISAFAGQTVRILISAADASTASLVEAAVDDVKIVQQP